MPRQLRTKNVDSSFCLTVRELKGLLRNANELNQIEDSTPVVLKCANRNYRLTGFSIVAGKPVLKGRRGKKDS